MKGPPSKCRACKCNKACPTHLKQARWNRIQAIPPGADPYATAQAAAGPGWLPRDAAATAAGVAGGAESR